MSGRHRLVSLFSLLLFSSLVFAYLWWGKFQYEHDQLLIGTYVAGIALVLANHLYHRDRLRDMGFRADNRRSAIRTFGLLTIGVAVAIVVIGIWKSQARLDRWGDLYLYIGWAALQQHLLQNFLRLRSEDILGRGHLGAAILAAALFALYHLPNLPLVVASFLGALVWCLLFMRVPSFPGAWLSQAILTGCLILFFKHGFLNQFQVGKPGHRYEYYGGGVNIAGGYDSNGKPFVVAIPGPDKGVPARVRIFDVDGKKRAEWTALDGFDFSGQVAAGDLGWGPGDEVVVAAGPGPRNPPTIEIYSSSGQLLKRVNDVLPDEGYGAWVAVACGRIYAAPGPGPGNEGTLFVLSGDGRVQTKRQFNFGFANSIRVTGVPSTMTGRQEQCPRLLLWGSPASVNPAKVFLADEQGHSVDSLETLPTTFGVNLTTLRLPWRQFGIAVAPGPLKGYPPLFLMLDMQGHKIAEFYAFHDPEAYGSNIAAVDTDGDGVDEVLLGEGIGPGRPATVRILRQSGELVAKWEAF